MTRRPVARSLSTSRPIIAPRCRLLTSILLTGCLVYRAGVAQTDTETAVAPGTHVMELNRTGHWGQAAELAQRLLAVAPTDSTVPHCELYVGLAYAQLRLGRASDAATTMNTFDRTCASLPANHWLRGAADQVRAELIPLASPKPAVGDDGYWKAVDPATVGVDADALERHRTLCAHSGADACLVVRRGKIVQEWYSSRFHTPIMAMSSTKSVTGLLVGMLLDERKIPGLDARVCTYVEQWCAGDKSRVTLKHLLTMTSGLPRMYAEGVGSVSNKDSFVVALPLTTPPGTTWAYSNEGVQLLSPILDEAAREPIQNYAHEHLFEPLGMHDSRLHLDERGHAWTYADMETTPRDFARLGVLMLNGGAWQGRRVVSGAWVQRSTEASQEFNRQYGLLWWLIEAPRGYAARGYLDTNLYVFPAQELVVVRMQSKPVAGSIAYEPAALRLFAEFAHP